MVQTSNKKTGSVHETDIDFLRFNSSRLFRLLHISILVVVSAEAVSEKHLHVRCMGSADPAVGR